MTHLITESILLMTLNIIMKIILLRKYIILSAHLWQLQGKIAIFIQTTRFMWSYLINTSKFMRSIILFYNYL